MRINLAWKNLLAAPKRTTVALLGVGFAVMLLFTQIGFLWSMRRGSTQLFDAIAGDLMIVSRDYVNLAITKPIDTLCFAQARAVPGVIGVVGSRLLFTEWKNKQTGLVQTCVVVELPSDPASLNDPALRAAWSKLGQSGDALVDDFSERDAGPFTFDAPAEVAGRNVTLRGHYRMGMALYANVALAVRPETFQQLARVDGRMVDYGFVRLAPGADREQVAAALRAVLPDDTIVHDKQELTRSEQDIYMKEKPVGIIFRTGAFVAFVVGCVVFYQVLSTEIANKLREFATLRALGFKDLYIYRVGVTQAVLFALFSYAPSVLLMNGIFSFLSRFAKTDMTMTPRLAVTVLALTIGMCGVSAYLALRRVRQADPADLF
jgi:putative ABC transport system permease protein